MKLKGKESRSIRCSKKKKEPIKVVYISNPIKVTASAAEFRALVQQLTGQDAADDLLPDLHPTRFPESTTGTHDDDNNNDFMLNPAPNSPSTATPPEEYWSSGDNQQQGAATKIKLECPVSCSL
ncbi:hypothetical protein M0R45_019934 [Rubus argutus]|uniref:VQ domain-containing protein n=1 Tax=Rubus argutus TaxID=59490 RepID=A0AAW1X8T5_RUBAR